MSSVRLCWTDALRHVQNAPCIPQIAHADLGERMLAALKQATEMPSRKVGHLTRGFAAVDILWCSKAAADLRMLQAILIGTDIPDICQAVLEKASAMLDEHQVRTLLAVNRVPAHILMTAWTALSEPCWNAACPGTCSRWRLLPCRRVCSSSRAVQGKQRTACFFW